MAAVRISATAVMSNMIQTDEAELTSYLLAQLAEKVIGHNIMDTPLILRAGGEWAVEKTKKLKIREKE